MLTALVVLTAGLLAVLGLRAERHRRAGELWACNAVAASLLVLTLVGRASGRV